MIQKILPYFAVAGGTTSAVAEVPQLDTPRAREGRHGAQHGPSGEVATASGRQTWSNRNAVVSGHANLYYLISQTTYARSPVHIQT